jgi:ArsR family transcriptional regulator, lead/cadmium/zinc/bismuth-responsive transcriptional repressor
MKKLMIEGKLCIGPNFSRAEFALMKRNLNEQKGLDTLAGLLETAGSPQRLKILYLPFAHKEMCVCDLSDILEISYSTVSQHLRKLKDKNLVRSRRHRQTIYYTLVPNVFTTFIYSFFSRDEMKDSISFIHKEVAM